jgi:ABC-2 type transport system permease protein
MRNRGGGFEASTVWQDYNPYRQLRSGRQLTNGFIFVRNEAPGADNRAFGSDELAKGITKDLFELLFIYPGAIQIRSDAPASLNFSRLVNTGTRTGSARTRDVQSVIEDLTRTTFGDEQDMSELPFEMRTVEKYEGDIYTLALRVKGKPTPSRSFNPLTGEGADPKANPPANAAPIDVVLVADIDMLNSRFFELRARPSPDTQNQFQFQNVPFVLNVLDVLAGDERYTDIRKRREHYGTLTGFEEQAEKVRRREEAAITKAADEFNKTRDEATQEKERVEKKMQDDLDKVEKTGNQGELMAAQYKRQMEMIQAGIKEAKAKEQARRKRNTELSRADDARERDTRQLEFRYKAAAVFVPPIPPLILALFVFLYRRSLEKEGVAKSRLR